MGALEELRAVGAARGDLVAVVAAPGVGIAMATGAGSVCVPFAVAAPADVVRSVEDVLRPRWVMWSNETAIAFVEEGVRLATAWDIAAVHRLLFGGWRADPALVWARLADLAI